MPDILDGDRRPSPLVNWPLLRSKAVSECDAVNADACLSDNAFIERDIFNRSRIRNETKGSGRDTVIPAEASAGYCSSCGAETLPAKVGAMMTADVSSLW